MPHYLWQGRYSHAAVKAMVAHPQDREAAARAGIEAAGGRLHAFYFAFGEADVVALIEFPDNVSVAAMGMVLGAAGGLSDARTTVLLTSAEAQAAMAKAHAHSGYKAPHA